jgi:hypothetical protein
MKRRIPLSPTELRKALMASVESIQLNIEGYLSGKRAGWMAVANQLYILLCDPNPQQSLLGRLLSHISFYPLKTQIKRPKTKNDVVWLMHSPAPGHFDKGNLSIELFDVTAAKMPMKKWLKQIIGVHNYEGEGHYTSIENLIYFARNQMGGGHLDPEWDAITKSLEFPAIIMDGITYPFYEWAIILVGHIVINEVKSNLGT